MPAGRRGHRHGTARHRSACQPFRHAPRL